MYQVQNFTVHPNLIDLTLPNSTFAEWAKDVWAANRTGSYSTCGGVRIAQALLANTKAQAPIPWG